jgi:uracil phosphoribosyltransferase
MLATGGSAITAVKVLLSKGIVIPMGRGELIGRDP